MAYVASSCVLAFLLSFVYYTAGLTCGQTDCSKNGYDRAWCCGKDETTCCRESSTTTPWYVWLIVALVLLGGGAAVGVFLFLRYRRRQAANYNQFIQ